MIFFKFFFIVVYKGFHYISYVESVPSQREEFLVKIYVLNNLKVCSISLFNVAIKKVWFPLKKMK